MTMILFRHVPVLLIAVVLACPHCCLSDAPQEVATTTKSCCNACSSRPTEQDPVDRDGEPAETPSQCLCAGAVVEKPAVITLELDAYGVVVAIAAISCDAPQLIDVPMWGAWHSRHGPVPPSGRALRALYASFLC